ncbi:MAG: PilZ domain-containing protein [Phycisphaerae bacterium]
MPLLQELNTTQINEVLQGATEKNVPLTICIREEKGWTNLHSRLLQFVDGYILVEPATPAPEAPPAEFAPGQKLGMSFKFKHYKHIASATMKDQQPFTLDDGTVLRVLRLCCPLHMHRVQRRAYLRASVPAGKIVRVSYWHGTMDDEPTGGESDLPVWSARVGDLSAGGFQALSKPESAGDLEEGDMLGVRLVFGSGEMTLYADAMFRHFDKTPEGEVVMGFQFMGLDQTPKGRQALKQIFYKVSDYLKLQDRSRTA